MATYELTPPKQTTTDSPAAHSVAFEHQNIATPIKEEEEIVGHETLSTPSFTVDGVHYVVSDLELDPAEEAALESLKMKAIQHHLTTLKYAAI